MRKVAKFDVRHEDPAPTARAASVRAPRELDANTREQARAQSMAERLQDGFGLARFAGRLRGAGR